MKEGQIGSLKLLNRGDDEMTFKLYFVFFSYFPDGVPNSITLSMLNPVAFLAPPPLNIDIL